MWQVMGERGHPGALGQSCSNIQSHRQEVKKKKLVNVLKMQIELYEIPGEENYAGWLRKGRWVVRGGEGQGGRGVDGFLTICSVFLGPFSTRFFLFFSRGR